MATVDGMAYAAGFRKAGETTTSNVEPDNLFGMEFVSSGVMPEGWFGLRTEKGVMCVGPKGAFWVPAFDPMQPIKMKL